jgi:hypothetical protein
MENEIDISKCSGVCGKLKLRKHVGTFDGKNKRFVDESGRLWNGRKCPDCHKNKVKVDTKEKRTNAKRPTDV